MRHIFSCLIRCVNMKWIRRVQGWGEYQIYEYEYKYL